MMDYTNSYLKNPSENISEIDQSKKKYMLDRITEYICLNKYFTTQDVISKDDAYGITENDGEYFGQVITGRKNGIGIKMFKNGDVYEGEFKNDLFNGKGLYKTLFGDLYQGEFDMGVKSGFGSLILGNKSSYEGEWQGDMKHGKGIWQDGKGNSYTGEWKFDEADGHGVMICKDGSRYEGEMKNSTKHGQGTETLAYGDFYSGEFVNGRFNGQGEYNWANGSSFKGQFKNGTRHGFGLWKRQLSGGNEFFEGYFLNDKREGLGFVTYQNKNYFKGYFKNDERHGYGEMNWVESKVTYRGQWSEDLQNGLGELKFEEQEYLAFFVKGIMIEVLDPIENSHYYEKLDRYHKKMKDDFNKRNSMESQNSNIAKILGETLNSVYNRKLYTPDTRKFLDDDLKITGAIRKVNSGNKLRKKVRNKRSGMFPSLRASRGRRNSTKINMSSGYRNKRLGSTGVSGNLSLKPRKRAISNIKSRRKLESTYSPYRRYKGRKTYMDGIVKKRAKESKPRVNRPRRMKPASDSQEKNGPVWKPTGKIHSFIF